MGETRKLAAILVSDVVGYSRLAGADEERILARLRALRSDLIDPTITVHHGRIVKRTGDGSIIEFRSMVDAVRCAIEVQHAMVERNAGVAPDKRIEFRIGVHLGDVIEEADGDLMGDGVNIASRLEGLSEPSGICLSSAAYEQVRDRLKESFVDLGEKQLKNITRPVRVYGLSPSAIAAAKSGAATPAPARKASRLSPHLGALAAALALALIAAGWFGWRAWTPPQTAARLSMVVLPFTNLSNDPAQDYFADGITENLTTELSRIHGSFVIARNTAFTFKSKQVDAKEIGKDLGVRYVLEGSVQRDQNRVRVNAQLIDAESGAHLWADRFAEDIADLFKLQDQVVARLANAMGYELVVAEAAKGAHSTNPDAIDLTMRGWAVLNGPPKKEEYPVARGFFVRALDLDARNAEAAAGLAYVDLRTFLYGWTAGDREEITTGALNLLAKATAINPNYAFAYYLRSLALFTAKRHADAVEASQMAIKINPNLAFGYFGMGQAEWPLGRCEQAITHINEAFKISQRDPSSGLWYFNIANAEFCLGRYDVAIEGYKRAVANYRLYLPYAYWAAAAAMKGDDAEAKWALGEAKSRAPDLTIKWLKARTPAPEFVVQGLLKAGLPEE